MIISLLIELIMSNPPACDSTQNEAQMKSCYQKARSRLEQKHISRRQQGSWEGVSTDITLCQTLDHDYGFGY
jgi:hypothetical protein